MLYTDGGRNSGGWMKRRPPSPPPPRRPLWQRSRNRSHDDPDNWVKQVHSLRIFWTQKFEAAHTVLLRARSLAWGSRGCVVAIIPYL